MDLSDGNVKEPDGIGVIDLLFALGKKLFKSFPYSVCIDFSL